MILPYIEKIFCPCNNVWTMLLEDDVEPKAISEDYLEDYVRNLKL